MKADCENIQFAIRLFLSSRRQVMFDGQPKRVLFYETPGGACPFNEWLEGLRDRATQQRIVKRIARLRGGNPGDYKAVGAGVYELRIDYGPGYRLYLAFAEEQLVILLGGGDKTTQAGDIADAHAAWQEYQQRTAP
jgi:putative addiction module killer protein